MPKGRITRGTWGVPCNVCKPPKVVVVQDEYSLSTTSGVKSQHTASHSHHHQVLLTRLLVCSWFIAFPNK